MNNLELLDRCVHVVVLSYEKNLKQTLINGMRWLHQLLHWTYPTEYMILTVDHIRQLVPAISCYSDDENDINVEAAIKGRLSDESIDILNPMFPAYFVSQIQLIVARRATSKLVHRIQISNCARVAGVYEAENDDSNDEIDGTCIYVNLNDGNINSYVFLKKNEIGDWVLKSRNETILFICNGSRCEALPPQFGWKRIDDADTLYQTQLPTLSYFGDTVEGMMEIVI